MFDFIGSHRTQAERLLRAADPNITEYPNDASTGQILWHPLVDFAQTATPNHRITMATSSKPPSLFIKTHHC